MTTVLDWAVGLAAVLENRPDARSITVELEPAGRVHVTRDGAKFIARGDVVDVDALLGEEAFGLTPLARGVDVELERV